MGNAKGCCDDSFVSTTTTTRWILVPNNTLDSAATARNHLIPLYTTTATASALVADTTPFIVRSTTNVPSSIPILVAQRTDVFRWLAASQLLYNPATTTSTTTSLLPTTNSELASSGHVFDAPDVVAVLEIGTSTGGTSEILWRQTDVTHWMGVDTSPTMVQAVQAKLEQFLASTNTTTTTTTSCHNAAKQRFACRHLDPLMDPDTAALLVRSHFDKTMTTTTTRHTTPRPLTVLVDIGGNREEGAVVRMIQWVLESFAVPPVSSLSSSSLDDNNGVMIAPLILHQIIVKSETVYAALQEQLLNQGGAALARGSPSQCAATCLASAQTARAKDDADVAAHHGYNDGCCQQ
jgi:hypothetical protein